MKRKLILMVSVLAIAFLGFSSSAFAQEASVFGDGVLVRAYINAQDSSGNDCAAGLYSAYLEVRNNDGTVITGSGAFSVIGVMGTDTPANNTTNPVQIHDCNLTNTDVSLSYDSTSKVVYVLCIDAADLTTPHVMTYDIGLTTPVNGVCGSSSGQAFASQPTSGLCSAGAVADMTSTANGWTWSCNGANGGTDATNCSANLMVNGACGSANGGTFSTLSATSSGLCSAGTVSIFQGSGPWSWSCSGVNGGTPATCSAQLQQSSGSLPDLTVSVSGWPSSYNVGSSFKLNVTVRNQGDGNAGSSNVKVTQSGGVAGTWAIGGLNAGGSISGTVSVSPNSSCSIHSWCTFTVTADGDGQVTESNESNNTASHSAYRGR